VGEIRKRGDVWWIRYYRNGVRHEESAESSKKGVAIDLLNIREGDRARGIPVTAKLGQLRFDTAAADVVTDYRINGKRSLEHVERRIRLHLTPFFGGRRMTSITTSDIRAFIAHRQAAVEHDDGTTTPGASNAEINRELSIIKRAFNLARKAGTLMFVPHIPMLQERNVRIGFFERDEFEAVRAALTPDLRPVATFAYLTGWRIPSEVLTLQWRQVDRQAGTVRLDPGSTKNDEGRLFPYGDLLPELRDVMDTQWQATKRVEQARDRLCPYVFHRNGEEIRRFHDDWKAACATAGCPTKIPHDFRRTAVRNLIRAGVPEKIAMKLTGHKTRSVFDRYDIVNDSDLREAVRKLGTIGTGTEKGQLSKKGRVARFRNSQKV
jgi:integrase